MTRLVQWQGRTVRLLWMPLPGVWRAVDERGAVWFVPEAECA